MLEGEMARLGGAEAATAVVLSWLEWVEVETQASNLTRHSVKSGISFSSSARITKIHFQVLHLKHRIADPVRFKDLVRFLMSNPGVYLSSKSVKGFLKISHPTLRKYLSYLENAYAVLALEKFSRYQKVRILNPKKVYPIDNGLLIRKDNKGHLLESCVVQHLRRHTSELFYWKDERGREVDVYLPEERIALQVVY